MCLGHDFFVLRGRLLGGQQFATQTLWAAVHWLNAGEVEPAHRRTAQAVRFTIHGKGAYTTVQGDKVYLERGDFAINSPWFWNDPGSEGTELAIWMDGLDVPLNNFLDAPFFEVPEQNTQDVTARIDGSTLKYGRGQLRSAWEEPVQQYSPISTYKWSLTEKALMSLAKVNTSPFGDLALEYTNPHTGRLVMETMTAWVQMLGPNVHTKAHRQVISAVYHVFEGEGAIVIGGVKFDWSQGNIFVSPSWAYHEHINESKSERAILFSIQDMRVLKARGKYREEALQENNGHQEVKESFEVANAGTRA